MGHNDTGSAYLYDHLYFLTGITTWSSNSTTLFFLIVHMNTKHMSVAWKWQQVEKKKSVARSLTCDSLTIFRAKNNCRFGTIVIPIALYLTTGFVFGYAKPVPVEFGNLRNPKRDMAWVALAGPGANFIMALMWLVFAVLLVALGVSEQFPHMVAQAGVLANLLMFAFNLLPIPPLDGGRVLTSMLPNRMAYQFARIEPYGFYIVLALIFFKLLSFWVMPVMMLGRMLLQLIASPLTLLLT